MRIAAGANGTERCPVTSSVVARSACGRGFQTVLLLSAVAYQDSILYFWEPLYVTCQKNTVASHEFHSVAVDFLIKTTVILTPLEPYQLSKLRLLTCDTGSINPKLCLLPQMLFDPAYMKRCRATSMSDMTFSNNR